MRKRDRALVLFEAGGQLHEHLLREVLFGDAPGKMGSNDANDQRVEMIHQFSRGTLIALAHAVEAASQIERQNVVVRHGRMEARTCTSRKTCLAWAGYRVKRGRS